MRAADTSDRGEQATAAIEALHRRGEPLPEPFNVDQMQGLSLLELDEERFGPEAVPAEVSERIDDRALSLELELPSTHTPFGCSQMPLKGHAVHACTQHQSSRA